MNAEEEVASAYRRLLMQYLMLKFDGLVKQVPHGLSGPLGQSALLLQGVLQPPTWGETLVGVGSEVNGDTNFSCVLNTALTAGIAEMDFTRRFTFPAMPSAQILICLMSANDFAVRHSFSGSL